MNSNNNGRLLATTTLLLLVASMTFSSAFADQTSVEAAGNVATNVVIEKGQCGQVDLTLIVDDTGSMGTAIGNVKANLPAIITQANDADVDTARVGLITFKDLVDVRHDLTATQANVIATIGTLAAADGDSEPESSNEAKNTAINNLGAGPRLDITGNSGTQTNPFTAPWIGTTNIIVLITDARPAGFDDDNDAADNTQMGSLGTAAATHVPKIKVSDVNVQSVETAAVADPLKADATNSGGIYKFTSNGVDTAQAIIDILAACGGESVTAGELLPINTTSLFISGLFTNGFWMVPAVAGIAGAGVFVIRSRMHNEEN